MNALKAFAFVLICSLLLPACTTEREYSVSHERLVDAALAAIHEETRVTDAEIKTTEREAKGGKVTVLEAPYNTYSRIKIEIDSTELQVNIMTDKILWTRHKEWEQRIHEIVLMKLRARHHGEESKPTALPPPVKK